MSQCLFLVYRGTPGLAVEKLHDRAVQKPDAWVDGDHAGAAIGGDHHVIAVRRGFEPGIHQRLADIDLVDHGFHAVVGRDHQQHVFSTATQLVDDVQHPGHARIGIGDGSKVRG
ncbi:hypothetical protein D3C81_1780730 [compost metagenome]